MTTLPTNQELFKYYLEWRWPFVHFAGGLDSSVKLWDVAKVFEEQDLEGLTTTNL